MCQRCTKCSILVVIATAQKKSRDIQCAPRDRARWNKTQVEALAHNKIRIRQCQRDKAMLSACLLSGQAYINTHRSCSRWTDRSVET